MKKRSWFGWVWFIISFPYHWLNSFVFRVEFRIRFMSWRKQTPAFKLNAHQQLVVELLEEYKKGLLSSDELTSRLKSSKTRMF